MRIAGIELDWKVLLMIGGLIIAAILAFTFLIPPDLVMPILLVGAIAVIAYMAFKLWFEKKEGTMIDPYKRGIQNKMRELNLARLPVKIPVFTEPDFGTNNPQFVGYAVGKGMSVIDKRRLKVKETSMVRGKDGRMHKVEAVKEEYNLEGGDFMWMIELEPRGDSKISAHIPLLFLDSQVHPDCKDSVGDICGMGTLRIKGFTKTIGPDIMCVTRDPKSLGLYKAEVGTMCLWESSIEQEKNQAIMADLAGRAKPVNVEGKLNREKTTGVEERHEN